MSVNEQPLKRWDPNHPPYIEGKDVPPKEARPIFRALVEAARISFADTAITKGGVIGEKETQAFWKFLEAAPIIDPEIFNESTQEHIQITGRMAVLVAGRINQSGNLRELLNLNEVEIIALGHDVGRTDSHHRGHSDLVGTQLLKLAGATSEFLSLFPPDDRWMPEADEAATVQKITDITPTTAHPTRAVVEIVDSIAKLDSPGILRRWDTVLADLGKYQEIDPKNIWPSEYKRHHNVLKHLKEVRIYYESLIAWVEKQMGCSLESVITEFEKTLPKDPIVTFSSAERVLPLHFKTAVFDVGGVLLFGPASQSNDQLIAATVQKLGVEDEEIKQKLTASFENGVNLLQVGRVTLEEMEIALIKEFGKEGDKIGLHELLLAGEYWVDPVVVNAIKYLRGRGIRVILASNTVGDTWESLVIPHLREAGLGIQNVGPVVNITQAQSRVGEIEAAGSIPVFASFDLGTRKGGGVATRPDGLGFFPIISEILGADNKDTISVDDKPVNSREAEEAGYKKGYDFITAADFIINLPQI